MRSATTVLLLLSCCQPNPRDFILDFIAYASTRRIERRRRYIIHSATRDMSDGLSDGLSGPVC